MTGSAADFEFAIVGTDESGAAFKSADKNARGFEKTAVSAHKHVAKAADGVKEGLEKVMAPAKAIFPEIDRLTAPLERAAKATHALFAAFKPRDAERTARAAEKTALAAKAFSVAGAARGLAGFGRAATGAAGEGAGVAEGAAGAAGAEAAGGAIAAAGAVAVGLAAFVVAIGAAALAVNEVGKKIAEKGEDIEKKSILSGVDARSLQSIMGAASRSGVSEDATGGALGALAGRLHNVQYGMGDPNTIAALDALGVKAPQKGEAIDLEKTTVQIADAISRIKDPLSQIHAADLLGVRDLLPMLRKGGGAVSADIAGYRATGAAYTDAQIEASVRNRRSEVVMGQTAVGKAKNAAFGAVDAGTAENEAATAALDGSAAARVTGAAKVAAAAAVGAVKGALSGPPPGPGAMLPPTPAIKRDRDSRVREAVAFYERNGFSDAGAVGVVANFMAEGNNLDPGQRQAHGGPGYGIGQWEPARQKVFERLFGKKMQGSSLEEQLQFSLYEMTRGDYKGVGKRLAASTDPLAATDYALHAYESPKNQGAGEERRREGYAQQIEGQILVKVDAPPGTKVVTSSKGPVGLKVERTAPYAGR